MLLLNAFSLNMVSVFPSQPLFEEISKDEVKKILSDGFTSAVGHADTARVFSNQICLTVETNRVSVSLAKGDVAIIGQYKGPRLEEGATNLPKGASIIWLKVTL
jgi:hypothetical protein